MCGATGTAVNTGPLIGGLTGGPLIGGCGEGEGEGDIGEGDDRVFGSRNADQIIGGPGGDTLFADPAAGNPEHAGGDDLLNGGAGDDFLRGLFGNETLLGGSGNDDLRGGIDNDRLLGGADDDTMLGGLGEDLVYGGSGADVVNGGGGTVTGGGFFRDLLQGGPGADTFVFSSASAFVMSDSRRCRSSASTWMATRNTAVDDDAQLTPTSRSGSAKGNGRRRTALMTVKMAVFAPMPSARQITAAAVKPGTRRSRRSAKRRSRSMTNWRPQLTAVS